MSSLRLEPLGPICRSYNPNGTYAGLRDRQGDPIEPSASTLTGGANTTYLVPIQDGVTGVVDLIQSAHDALLSKGGGTLNIAPRKAGLPKYLWDKTFFWDPRVRLPWLGKGSVDFVLIDHLALASFTTRDPATGVVAYGPIDRRCAIYLIPYAPFDPRGTIITPSAEGIQAIVEGFSLDGNKANQDDEVAGIYAPVAKSDPNWPFAAGAWDTDQVAHPGQGAVNMNADAQAYYGFRARGVDIYNTSGTQFVALADRQRTHLLEECRGTLGGVNNPDGSVKWLARGYDIQGNDSWVAGGGWGNNNAIPQGNQQSGMLTWGNNFFINRGADSSHVRRDLSVNGYASVCNVYNGLTYVQTPSGNPVAARAGGFAGNSWLWTSNQMQASGPNAGRPLGITADMDDAYHQVSGYRQNAMAGNSFSVATDGSSPLFHLTAVNGGGSDYWGIATSEPGPKSYRGSDPWGTDGTGGAIGGGRFDPYMKTLYFGVQYLGLYVGADITDPRRIAMLTTVRFAAGVEGRSDGAAAGLGYVGETGTVVVGGGAPTAIADGVLVLLASMTVRGDLDLDVNVNFGGTTVAGTDVQLEVLFDVQDDAKASLTPGDKQEPLKYASRTKTLASFTGVCENLKVGPIRNSTSVNVKWNVYVRRTGGTGTWQAFGGISRRRPLS